ncbi:glucosamine-6-phosphate isomerase [Clostridium sp. NSJ-145]|uniref:6-phosphogluconolactonase n=1 Tax=Clostridium sp. NSJ-145 TaxID=2897777 RepID=UPI001E3CEA7F|nr:glucosamine-6-phosphate isomerase [Clostridium sp. NSJ-145]MCD2502029.1 glucosamine-6-phosphate isomerase [Clostridium sp. NSJ-145]
MYKKTIEELVNNDVIDVKVLGDAGEVFYEMALDMIEEINKNNEEGKRTVFICPVGPTGQYPIFVRLVNKHKISLKNVWFINMDEYMIDENTPISKGHELSFRGFMEKSVYSKIDLDLVMSENQRIFPEVGNEQKVMETIEKLGGVDICFGGIGINGHIAFNEPPEQHEVCTAEDFKNRTTRVLNISRETITINAVGSLGGAIKAMPKMCITIGMKEILSARKIKLYCFRDWHGAIVREGIFGERTVACPLSLLRDHNDVEITLTSNAAKMPY